MNSLNPIRFFAVLLCLCAATIGCNTKRKQQQSLDALHKEMRWQEDQIYQLQDAIEEYQEALSKCRTGQRPPSPSAAPHDASRDDGSLIAPKLPQVDLGEPDKNGGDLPPIDSIPAPDEPKNNGGAAPPTILPLDNNIPLDKGPQPIDMSSADVKEIRLHAILTGGIDRDGRPGDEGLQVVIEPLDAQGNVLSTSGDIVIALMDHTLPEGSQRLAYWTFDAGQAEKKIRRGGISNGLQFDLMWGSDRYPTHRELDVYIRYTTSDGRQLDTRGRVRIRLPEDVAHWKKTERLPDLEPRQPNSIRPVSAVESIAPKSAWAPKR